MKRTADDPDQHRSNAPGVRSTTGNAQPGIEFVSFLRSAGDERQQRARGGGGPWQLPPELMEQATRQPPAVVVTARPEPPLRPSLGSVPHEQAAVAVPVRTEVPLPAVGGALDVSRVPAGALGVPTVPAGFNACVRLRSQDEETETTETAGSGAMATD